MQGCSYVVQVDRQVGRDRYGNRHEVLLIYSTVPVVPGARGYDPAGAEAVLELARAHKAADPDLEVEIRHCRRP